MAIHPTFCVGKTIKCDITLFCSEIVEIAVSHVALYKFVGINFRQGVVHPEHVMSHQLQAHPVNQPVV